jgi:cytochrome c
VENTPDGTPPSTTIAVSGVSGSQGWYRSPAIVALTGTDSDGTADVAFIDYRLNGGPFERYSVPFMISSEGLSQITARATDNSGAVEAPLSSAFVKIDTTGPVVVIASPEQRAYLHGDLLTVTFSTRDDVSGLVAGGVSAALDAQVTSNGDTIALLGLPLGMHTATVSAVDIAGNGTQQSITFTVIATIDSLIAAVNAYGAQGQIDATTRKTLLAKLNDAKAAQDRGNTTAARGSLRDFIDHCSARSGKGVAPSAATVLVSDAQYVLTTL